MDTNELLYKQKWPYNIASESHSVSVQLFATPWTVQSMEFYRPEYGVGSLSLL